jgi:16S rRNA processing protein RimM
MSRDILLGVVIGAQGLKGEVKVKTFTDSALAAYGVLHARDGRQFTVTSERIAKPGIAVARFAGVTTRDGAEALKGEELFVTRDALPAPGDDEFYHIDLIGLAAQDGEGRALGTVSALHNFGAGDVIAIARPDGDEIILPFTRAIVPLVDIKAGRIVVVAPDETGDEETDSTDDEGRAA